jgi:Family of unknown function (DUF6304)
VILADVVGKLMYERPQVYPAVVTDQWGAFETEIHNDGERLSMLLRGGRFAGDTLDGLDLVEPPAQTGQPPALHYGRLCSCVIAWRMPIRVARPGGQAVIAPLHARLSLGGPARNGGIDHVELTLALHLPDGVVETAGPEGWLGDALTKLQGRLPEGTRILACITCAFSDYPPGGWGFMGSLGCFRDRRDAHRDAAAHPSPARLLGLWNNRTGLTQETFLCSEYEPRPPDAG